MSHGKSLYLKGSVSVDIGGRSEGFSAEEKLTTIKGHAQDVSVTKAEKAILGDLNAQIASKWKKKKAAGSAPDVTKKEVDWSYRTGK